MTNGFFCDVHADETTSSQREDRPKYNIRLTREVQEINKRTGKKEKWSSDMNPIASCQKDATELIINRANALGVQIVWGPRYKLTRSKDGKFLRVIHPDDMSVEEKEAADQYEAEKVPQLTR